MYIQTHHTDSYQCLSLSLSLTLSHTHISAGMNMCVYEFISMTKIIQYYYIWLSMPQIGSYP